MTLKPTIFEFTFYSFEPEKRLASFNYTIHFANRQPLIFTEKLTLPYNQKISADIPPQLLENILQGLHLIIGISYYKLYCPPEIKLNQPISPEQAIFWNTVYRKGLGEFLYRNNLEPGVLALFPGSAEHRPESVDFKRSNRSLIGIGGGKDSLVAVELLKEQKIDATAILIETQKPNLQAQSVMKATKLPSLIISRELDPQIFEKHPDSFNGHIPISAVLAWIGVFAAALYDYRYTIVANEFSSNFGNLEYKGEIINHQWSKSQEFETLFQEYIRNFVTPNITYFSILRPFYELRIAKLFSTYPKYFSAFSSCNAVAKINPLSTDYSLPSTTKWCGVCAKCAFVFAILAPWLPKKKLISIFGKNLFEDETLVPLFKDLIGQGNLKPFDCVGTFEEVQTALHLSRKIYGKTIVFKTLEHQLAVTPETIARVMKTQDSPLIPAPFRFSGMKTALILGYGKEGKVTQEFMRKKFPKLKLGIADQNRSKNYLQMQADFDIAIKTPGIPKRFVSIPYTTATNLFFSQISNLTIGVTGTKGKSTTSSLIYAILKKAGKKVSLLGNIGVPMLGALKRSVDPREIFVLELSSHQLDDSRYSPNIAVISNLFPEHLPYHQGEEPYYLAKKNIIKFQRRDDSFVFNPEDHRLVEWAKEARSKTVPFTTELPVSQDELPLIGVHNYNNVRAAVTVAKMLSVPDEIIREAILNFKPLPHRLEKVGTFKGITFYDDAISTTPESTIMALRSLKNVGTIFLGGEDRGYDFKTLEAKIRVAGIKNIVLFPDTGNRLFVEATDLNIFRTEKMKDAIAFAYKHTPQGSICLLSTASPSYSLWKDFNEKGDQFQKYAKLLGKKGG